MFDGNMFKGRLLREEGTIIKEWKSRVSILEDGYLKFFEGRMEDVSKKTFLTSIHLKGYRVSPASSDSRFIIVKGGRETTFVVVKDDDDGEIHTKDWMHAVDYHITYANTGSYPSSRPSPSSTAVQKVSNPVADVSRAPQSVPQATPQVFPVPISSPQSFSYPGGTLPNLTPLQDTNTYHSLPPISVASTTAPVSSQYNTAPSRSSLPPISSSHEQFSASVQSHYSTPAPVQTPSIAASASSSPYDAQTSTQTLFISAHAPAHYDAVPTPAPAPVQTYYAPVPAPAPAVLPHFVASAPAPAPVQTQTQYAPAPAQYVQTQFVAPAPVQAQYYAPAPAPVSQIPNIITDKWGWFNHFDVQRRGKLSKAACLQGLLETFPTLDRISAMSVLDACWPYFDLNRSGDIDGNEFSKPGGFADTIALQLSPNTNRIQVAPPVTVQASNYNNQYNSPAQSQPSYSSQPSSNQPRYSNQPGYSQSQPSYSSQPSYPQSQSNYSSQPSYSSQPAYGTPQVVSSYSTAPIGQSYGAPQLVSAYTGNDPTYGHVSSQVPLPPNWEQMTATDGRTYYVDHNTKSTTWTRPV